MKDLSNVKKILFVIDAQRDFVLNTAPLAPADKTMAKKAVNNIESLVGKYYNDPEWLVIFTQDIHSPFTYPKTREGRALPIKHCVNSDGTRIIAALEPYMLYTDEILVWQKSNFGFANIGDLFESAWEYYDLNPDNIEEINFCGFDTDYCVISSAITIAAYLLNPDINIIADACCGSTREDHDAALKMMEHLQMNITEVADYD